MNTEEAAKRFPNIFDACMEEGYDITKDKVPVTPAQHYICLLYTSLFLDFLYNSRLKAKLSLIITQERNLRLHY